MDKLTHLDEKGRVRMVDVTQKPATLRRAVAGGTVFMSPETLEKILSQEISKGNVFETARIAGIMAAKRTWDLIPMCHPLSITHASVEFQADRAASAVHIRATVQLRGSTGVEMEALIGVSVALNTIWDMVKYLEKDEQGQYPSTMITDIKVSTKEKSE